MRDGNGQEFAELEVMEVRHDPPKMRVRVGLKTTASRGWEFETTAEVEWFNAAGADGDYIVETEAEDGITVRKDIGRVLHDLLHEADREGRDEVLRRNALDRIDRANHGGPK